MKTKTKQAGPTGSVNESDADPRLLCEGWIDEGCEGSSVFIPERAYVVQGDKVWFAYGDTDTLDESEALEIVESYDDLELEERLVNGSTVKMPKGGRWVVEGPGQRSDVKNANQRTYSRKIWEKLVADKDSYVQQAITERQMVGHLEHPKDGRTDLNNAAILTTKAELREDGVVWNQFELLDTPGGMILQELTRKGVKWGVSSRGTGTVGDDGHVSEDDYTLKTWDAVASPSTPGAHPKLVLGYGKTRNEATLIEAALAVYPAGGHAIVIPGVEGREAVRKKVARAVGADFLKLDGPYGKDQHRIILVGHRKLTAAEQKKIRKALSETHTDEDEPVLSEEGSQTLEHLTELVETEADGISESVVLRQDILETLSQLNEMDLRAMLFGDSEFEKVHAAIKRARDLSQDGDIDAAIDEALASGDDEDDEGGNLMATIEDLQEQVSDSVTETIELRDQLEAVESERAAQTERLAVAEGELAQLRAECDLARELLAETSGHDTEDVAAAADEAISEEPELERFRDLMESVETIEQVRTLAEHLAPVVPEPAPVVETEEPVKRTKPKRTARTALPVGVSLVETRVKRSSKAVATISESSGASIVAKMPGFKK